MNLGAKLRRPGTQIFLGFFAVTLVVALFLQGVKLLNLIVLGSALLLALTCVALIPPAELTTFYRLTLWVFLFGFLLNVAYELLHSVLFDHFYMTDYTYPDLVIMLFEASVADGFILLSLLFAVTAVRGGRWEWQVPWRRSTVLLTLALAALGQTLGEIIALETGAWGYTEAMPRLPLLGVGLTPLLQMPLLVLPTFWLAQQLVLAAECEAT